MSTRDHSIKAVPLAKMRVSTNAQRTLRPSRVAALAAHFDLNMLGHPVVSHRDGFYWVVDGQTRIEALKIFLGAGWEKQSVDCRVYHDMTERDEADMFDHLSDSLPIAAFDKFKVRNTALRPDETAVAKVLEKAKLVVTRDVTQENGIGAVGALMRVYRRSDAPTLLRALLMVRDSFGAPGMTAAVIDGTALLCQRYNGALDDASAVERFGTLRGGVGALMTEAMVLRKQTGRQLPQCVAAAMVDTLNSKRGGKKLPSWWMVK